MNHEELPSDSDSSDEDYKPTGIDNELSEEESDNGSADDPGSGTELTNENRKKRRKSTNGKIRKKFKKERPKIDEEDDKQKEEEKENSETSVSEEDKKKKSDKLWEDFLSECPPPKMSLDSPSSRPPSLTDPPTEAPTKPPVKTSPIDQPSKLNQLLTFAGEKVVVDMPISAVGEPSSPLVTPGGQGRGRGRGRGAGSGGSSSGGLSSILGQLGKKGRLSTLEKSKLDWDSFKREEGINEDLHSHNKGKNGYLEKQDFLERTDLRQFELEKSLRASRRPFNR